MVIAAVMVTIGIIITVITILQNLFCYGKVYRSESQFTVNVTRSADNVVNIQRKFCIFNEPNPNRAKAEYNRAEIDRTASARRSPLCQKVESNQYKVQLSR